MGARSIQEFGFRQRIVVSKDHVIIAGDPRWKAALKLGLSTVPIHMASGFPCAPLASAAPISQRSLKRMSVIDYFEESACSATKTHVVSGARVRHVRGSK